MTAFALVKLILLIYMALGAWEELRKEKQA
jgi:hypothetical protein